MCALSLLLDFSILETGTHQSFKQSGSLEHSYEPEKPHRITSEKMHKHAREQKIVVNARADPHKYVDVVLFFHAGRQLKGKGRD